MNTVNIDLVGAVLVRVPVTLTGKLDDSRLAEIAEEAYKHTINGHGPAQIHTLYLDRVPQNNALADDGLSIVYRILREYYRIWPAFEWYNEHGYPVSDSAILIQAIGKILLEHGYVVITKPGVALDYDPGTLLLDILTRSVAGSGIVSAIGEAIYTTHEVVSYAHYWELTNNKWEPWEPMTATADSIDSAF